MTLKIDAKLEEKLSYGLKNEEIGKFLPEHSKASKLGISWDPSIKSRKCISLKFIEELFIMTMKHGAKLMQCKYEKMMQKRN